MFQLDKGVVCMTFNEFINAQVSNINNESGIVLSIDQEHVVIKYPNVEKTYNTEIVFKNKFLSFVSEELNKKMDAYVNHRVKQEEEKKQLFQDNKDASILRQKKVNEIYKKLALKNYLMKALFGNDFYYPPYEEFVKKYKHQIHIPKFRNYYSYRYWEYL